MAVQNPDYAGDLPTQTIFPFLFPPESLDGIPAGVILVGEFDFAIEFAGCAYSLPEEVTEHLTLGVDKPSLQDRRHKTESMDYSSTSRFADRPGKIAREIDGPRQSATPAGECHIGQLCSQLGLLDMERILLREAPVEHCNRIRKVEHSGDVESGPRQTCHRYPETDHSANVDPACAGAPNPRFGFAPTPVRREEGHLGRPFCRERHTPYRGCG